MISTVPARRTLHRRAVLACAAATVLLPSAAWADERPSTGLPPPVYERSKQDPRWVVGQVNVTVAPDAVWRRLQQIEGWPRMFSDIKWLKVIKHDGPEWKVRLDTVTFDCGPHDYDVSFQANRTAKLSIDAPSVSAFAFMTVRDLGTPDQANVVYGLFLEARGMAKWFMTEKKLREKQEAMVSRYLSDLQRTFSRKGAGA